MTNNRSLQRERFYRVREEGVKRQGSEEGHSGVRDKRKASRKRARKPDHNKNIFSTVNLYRKDQKAKTALPHTAPISYTPPSLIIP